jgi:hypothetical protein
MDEHDGRPLDVADAIAAARSLLETAEADAAAVRAAADHYARQREQEAELLVAKARRLLSVAEEKAAGIVTAARSGSARDVVIDLDAAAVTIPISELSGGEIRRIVAPRRAAPAGFDDLLASAIASAVDRTFPLPERAAG